MGTNHMSNEPETPPPDAAGVELSFVVIGYNESPTLRACLASVRAAQASLPASELIYVDGGSTDDSVAVAIEAGVDLLLGGERRRRAAENRNLGLRAARGRFVQFVDGDMALAPDWPAAALGFLREHPECAAVCGNLREAGEGALFRALQIDWAPREGPIRHCGGAAMYARDVLRRVGGFPEDVAYGEEPLLCWRIRNQINLGIYQIDRIMADHDLGFRGFRDYWRRNVRCGRTYAEIAARCRSTADPLWRREALANAAWAATLGTAVPLAVFGGMPLRGLLALCAVLILLRKCIQTRRRGYSWGVSAVYAAHTYFSKIPIALGELRWLLGRPLGRRGKQEPAG